MTNSLEYNLFSKHKLKFNENHKFKILMLSDIQETLFYDKRTVVAIENMLDREKPSLVFLGGDNCNGMIMKSSKELKRYLDIFTKPMEERKIPWAHVFGNHDHDMNCSEKEQQEIYETYSYCISKHTNDEIKGKSNFVLPVYHSETENVIYHIWGLDSNNQIKQTYPQLKDEIRLANHDKQASRWDIIHFSQLKWYYETSVELEKYYNKKIPGILITHIPPWEFQTVVDNPIRTNLTGNIKEKLGLGALNSGLFSTILERGDIKCIASGHIHKCDFDADYCNIKLCFDACCGFTTYGIDSMRGGRIFEFDENKIDDIKTYMIRSLDYLHE